MSSELQTKLNSEYSKLCTVLGDLEYKIKILSDERDSIVEKIKILSTLSGAQEIKEPSNGK